MTNLNGLFLAQQAQVKQDSFVPFPEQGGAWPLGSLPHEEHAALDPQCAVLPAAPHCPAALDLRPSEKESFLMPAEQNTRNHDQDGLPCTSSAPHGKRTRAQLRQLASAAPRASGAAGRKPCSKKTNIARHSNLDLRFFRAGGRLGPCTPIRAAFMTSRYPFRYGLQKCIPPGSTASEANYTTVALGKWHLGTAAPRNAPLGRGFGHHLGYFQGEQDHFTKRVCSSICALANASAGHCGCGTSSPPAPPTRQTTTPRPRTARTGSVATRLLPRSRRWVPGHHVPGVNESTAQGLEKLAEDVEKDLGQLAQNVSEGPSWRQPREIQKRHRH